jgi:polar amino acid transport system substrate-binding protein
MPLIHAACDNLKDDIITDDLTWHAGSNYILRMTCSIFRRFLTVALFLVAASATGLSGQTVTMYAIEYPPYSVVNAKTGEASGLAVDVTRAAGEAAGVDVVIETAPMARIGISFAENERSALIGLKGWIADKNVDTESVDILNLGFVFYYKKNRFPQGLSYKMLEELKPYTIGNVRGSATLNTLEAARLKLELVGDVSLVFKMLEAERIDLAVGGDITGRLVIRDLYPDKISQLESTSHPFFTTLVCVIFNKSDSEMITKFKDGIRAIYKNGVYQKILETYCPPGVTAKNLIPQYIYDLVKQ